MAAGRSVNKPRNDREKKIHSSSNPQGATPYLHMILSFHRGLFTDSVVASKTPNQGALEEGRE